MPDPTQPSRPVPNLKAIHRQLKRIDKLLADGERARKAEVKIINRILKQLKGRPFLEAIKPLMVNPSQRAGGEKC